MAKIIGGAVAPQPLPLRGPCILCRYSTIFMKQPGEIFILFKLRQYSYVIRMHVELYKHSFSPCRSSSLISLKKKYPEGGLPILVK
jgi:hypothetical protein